MPVFVYQALTATGQRCRGTIEANDPLAAQSLLEDSFLVPITIDQGPGGDGGPRPAPAQVLGFTRSLAGLLAGGVPLSRALTVIEQETVDRRTRALWSDIHHRVRDGSSLADALAAHPHVFSAVFIAMVRSGETGGFLDTVLEQVADYMERQRELRSKVTAALVYPSLLALVSAAVVLFLLLWFIPRFAELFASFGQELPLLTRTIQHLSSSLLAHGWLLAGLVIGGAGAGHALLRHPRWNNLWQRLRLGLPGLGPVILVAARVRFCRMLGTLLHAGVPLLNALDVARATIGNRVVEGGLGTVLERVRHGDSLRRAFDDLDRLLPDTSREVLAVAEDAGCLPRELLRLAETGDRDLDRRLRSLAALLEPLLLLVMATIVGLIVIGMLLPIFDLWSAVS